MKKDRRVFVVPKKVKKPKKKMSKRGKIILFSSLAFVIAAVTTGLCLYFFLPREVKYSSYMRSYAAERGTTTLTKGCVLENSVSLYEYDVNNDVFITSKKYYNDDTMSYVMQYGLASFEKEYAMPLYSAVLSIRGDYAIVTVQTNTNHRIGLIRFRGNGITTPKTVSDFSLVYDGNNTEQMYFCGDYVCVMGGLDGYSSSASFTVFYDYTHGEMLPCFKIRYGYNATNAENYSILQYDDYIVAYCSTDAYFFDIKKDLYNGVLEYAKTGAYTPFAVVSDAMSDCNGNIQMFYMGNGWFLRSNTLSSSSAFDGFNLCYYTSDLFGETSLVFTRSSADFYNVKTRKTTSISQVFGVVSVANTYSAGDYAITANSYNNTSIKVYSYPCLNPADMVREGKSIIYYYYRPYIELTKDLSETEQYFGALGEMTYCVVDENLNVYQPSSMLPVVFIDGVGFECADPAFDPYYGDACIFDEKLEKKVLLKKSEQFSYSVVHSGTDAVLIACIDAEKVKTESEEESETEQEATLEEITYGAVTPAGKVIVDCVYSFLTPFYDGYAVGTRTEGGQEKVFRIDLFGRETELADAVLVKDGFYVFAVGEKYGIKSFDGTVLSEAGYKGIAVLENFMVNGVLQETYIVASQDDTLEIMKVEKK